MVDVMLGILMGHVPSGLYRHSTRLESAIGVPHLKLWECVPLSLMDWCPLSKLDTKPQALMLIRTHN